MTNIDKNYYINRFECDCSSMDHNIRMILDPEDGAIFLDINLSTYLPWYSRVWKAIKYIFMPGKSRYGHYDAIILKIEDYSKIKNLLEKSEKIIKSIY